MKFHINSILPILLSVASTFIKVNAAPANTINQFTPGVKEFRMAIIGDSGAVEEAKEVMELSPFDIMLHVGDYDYEKNTEAYFEKILDADRKYKFVGVLGNHEEVYEVQQEKYERFVSNVYNEMVSKTKNNGVVCKFSPSRVMWACTYENMKMIGLTPNIDGADKPAEQLKFLKENLNQSTTEDWRACAWHYYDDNFHTGHYEDKHKDYVSGKVGESLYEYCKQHGAFIFSGHDHVYARSRVLSKFDGTVPTIDPSDSKTGPEIVQIRKGASINILNGAGGWSLYDERGKYKDFEWWQKTYALYESKKNGHNQGGLFCTFNVGGNSRKAYCEFQLIRLKDKVYDNFTIYRNDDPVNVPYTQIDENFKAILNGQVNDALPPQSNGNKGNVDNNNNNNNKGTEGQEKGNNDNLVDTLFTKKNIIIGGSVCAAVAVIGGGILLFSKSNKKYTDDDHVNKEDEGYYNFKNNYNNNDNDNNDIRRYDFNNGDSDNRRYRDIMDNSNDSTYFKRSKSLLENSDFNPLPVPYEKNFYQDNNKFNKYKENGNNKYSDVTPLVSNQQKQRQGQKTYNLPYTTTSYYNNEEEDHEIEQNRQDNKRQYYRDRKNQESSLDQSSEELRYPYSQKSFKSEREPNYNTKFLNHRNSQELRYTKGSKDSNPNHQLNNKRSKEMKYYRDYYRDKQNMRDNNDTRDVRDDTRDIRDQRDPEAQYNYRNIRNNNYNDDDDDDIENQRYASSSRNPRNQEPRLNNKSSRELRNKSSRELRYQNKSSKNPGTQESQFKYRSERNQETDFNYRNERNQESEYNFRNRRNQESELNNYNNNNDYNNYNNNNNNNNNNNKVLRKAYSQRRYEEMKRTERGVPTMRLTKYNEEEEEEEENPRNYNYFNQNKKYNYNTSNNNNFLFSSLSRNTTNESTPTKQQYSRYDKYQ
ncbi:Metallo-dependent phosphatase [Anaeromyces robustus]|uniref:Metallo-dependent phosphatase n=1 Tax=Anaeromyces robustus TaxID=1754192 RepID=A0A1Y1XFG2_9FUNG|nr:Metallo-dependent phosphatase [Anaeromyces robustus]|eukprot:ORX84500.1 Metallo-dependent phosphatase [Anaeromyces robustus]